MWSPLFLSQAMKRAWALAALHIFRLNSSPTLVSRFLIWKAFVSSALHTVCILLYLTSFDYTRGPQSDDCLLSRCTCSSSQPLQSNWFLSSTSSKSQIFLTSSGTSSGVTPYVSCWPNRLHSLDLQFSRQSVFFLPCICTWSVSSAW